MRALIGRRISVIYGFRCRLNPRGKMPSTRSSRSKATENVEPTDTAEIIASTPKSPVRKASAYDDTGIRKYSIPTTRVTRRSLKRDPYVTRPPPKRRNPPTQTGRGPKKSRKIGKPPAGGGEWYRIKGILAHRRAKSRFDYLVSWWGYSKEHDQWLGENDIRSEDIIAYWRGVEEDLSKWRKLK